MDTRVQENTEKQGRSLHTTFLLK